MIKCKTCELQLVWGKIIKRSIYEKIMFGKVYLDCPRCGRPGKPCSQDIIHSYNELKRYINIPLSELNARLPSLEYKANPIKCGVYHYDRMMPLVEDEIRLIKEAIRIKKEKKND